jgi:hypothetical protein
MNDTEYIEQRVDDQIAWHDRQAKRARRFFHGLSAVAMVFTASLTILTRFAELSLISTVVSVIATLAGGFLGLGQYQDRWVQYRLLADGLRAERLLYLTRTGVYASDGAFPVFVGRVEVMLGQGLGEWRQRATRAGAGAGAQRVEDGDAHG